MAKLDLPDPLNSTPDHTPQLSLDNADDLISQLAGEEIDRLIGPDEQWQPRAPSREPIAISRPVASEQKPVEDLAAELDQLFDEIRTQQAPPPRPEIDTSDPEPITLPEPVLAMRKFEEIDDRDLVGRRSLLDPIEDPPLPKVLRPLAWLNAPVAQLQGKSRLAINAVSLLSFVGSVAAFVYVLILRKNL
jgi:hypothetical protein